MADDTALDGVMRALADPTRRRMFALLRRRPGLTTSELSGRIPGMTRWGVMKHLAALREAGLVHTFPDGRRRRHYVEPAGLGGLRGWLDANEG